MNKKIKLLFVISQFYKGGAEVSLLNLIKRLDKRIYEIELIVLNQCPAGQAVSLLDQIPAEISVFDAWKEDLRLNAYTKKLAVRMLRQEAIQQHSVSALMHTKHRVYDWAFHIGEWWNPGFVAEHVNAANKCAWIHNDLSHAEYFDADGFFRYHDHFSHYIFVSENSLQASVSAFPFLKKNSSCIYNINDAAQIRLQAAESVSEDYFTRGIPVVLTCANVRLQKNHDRQLTAMSILKNRGLDFLWLNLGSTAEKERCDVLLERAAALGLEDRFLLAGPRENPYKYMERADIVSVLSDYESWSMVITEAKILKKAILSTKTSGALEQITDRETGLLADFSAEDIADRLQELLTSEKLRGKLEENLKDFDNTQSVLESFDALVRNATAKQPTGKSLLYIIDDITYIGGAHIATKRQIRELLKENYEIFVFSGTTPSVDTRIELPEVTFLGWKDCQANTLYNRRILDCILDPNIKASEKLSRIKWTYRAVVHRDTQVFPKFVLPTLSELFSCYDTVCVMSESSPFRSCVAQASCRKKIQWIHTDYCAWKHATEFARKASEKDESLWQSYDTIVLLSDSIRRRFAAEYPSLKNKLQVVPNILPIDTIRQKALHHKKDLPTVNFVTVCRFEPVKAIPRLLKVLRRLHQEGYPFTWTFIGHGEEAPLCRQLVDQYGLSEEITFTGMADNPYIYIKQADVFGLFSMYEGLPNVIYEALALGIPVCATNVGGIADQISPHENGWLSENSEIGIYNALVYILENQSELNCVKENIKDYSFDNEGVVKRINEVFS